MNPRTIIRLTASVTVLVVALVPCSTTAQEPTGEEWAILPHWCSYTAAYDGKRGARRFAEFVERYGPEFGHMHHYCWALLHEMRSMNSQVPAQLRRTHETSALADYDYMLERTKPGFVFRIDILKRKAALLKRMGEADKAVAAAKQAIEEFPEDAGGYVAAALVYAAANRRDLVQQVLDSGEKRVSDPTQLKRARDVLLPR